MSLPSAKNSTPTDPQNGFNMAANMSLSFTSEKVKEAELKTLVKNSDQLFSEKSAVVEDYDDFPLTEDTTCGFWVFRGPFCQKFVSILVKVSHYAGLVTNPVRLF